MMNSVYHDVSKSKKSLKRRQGGVGGDLTEKEQDTKIQELIFHHFLFR